MNTRTSFITLDTRQITSTEATTANSQARHMRETDLNEYSKSGYELRSTIVVPQEDGIVIVDTLARTHEMI